MEDPQGDKKNELSKKYKVSGIPTLVLLNGATGELITKDGRAAIMEDPQGENFPWTPPTLNELWESLGESFLGQGGAAVPRSSLEGKKTRPLLLGALVPALPGVHAHAGVDLRGHEDGRAPRRRGVHLRVVGPGRGGLRRVLRGDAVARAAV